MQTRSRSSRLPSRSQPKPRPKSTILVAAIPDTRMRNRRRSVQRLCQVSTEMTPTYPPGGLSGSDDVRRGPRTHSQTILRRKSKPPGPCPPDIGPDELFSRPAFGEGRLHRIEGASFLRSFSHRKMKTLQGPNAAFGSLEDFQRTSPHNLRKAKTGPEGSG